MDITNHGIILLIKSAVTGRALHLPETFSLENAMPVIRRQHLETLAYQGALNCGISPKEECMQKLLKRYYFQLIHNERQLAEIGKVFEVFEKNGIDYLPLKGCILKNLYPKPELRPMGDADILIRMDQYQRIVPIMQELQLAEGRESHHELVWKNEALYLELHKCLFEPAEKDFYPIFGSGWSRAVRESEYRFALSDEDTFIYLFAHMTKHYRFSGIGCRHLLDLYVFRNSHTEMDENYIEKIMAELHLLEFYHNISRLLDVWFEEQLWDEKTVFMTEYIFDGGSWGTLETRFSTEHVRSADPNQKIQHTRMHSIVQAIFPPLHKLQNDYKILLKYPKLYPLFWIPRWLKGLFFRPGVIIRKFAVLMNISDDKVSDRRNALEYVGLKQDKTDDSC